LSKLSEMFGLAGRVALVTGGASGIGEGIARVLAEAGARVVVLDRDEGGAEAVAASLGRDALARSLDIADEAAVAATITKLAGLLGAPWLLVNCAGVQDRLDLLDGTGPYWDRMFEVNVRGSFFCLREVAKAMIAGGVRGRIVNITSTSASFAVMPGLAAYAASKHGLHGLTMNAALELAEHGITVNAIAPGGVGTPGAMNATGPAPSLRAQQEPPLGRVEPADIGGAVLYFASPIASRTTGQSLAVEAGFHLG